MNMNPCHSIIMLDTYNLVGKYLTTVMYLSNNRLLMMKKNLSVLKVLRGRRIMGLEYWRGLLIATSTKSVKCIPQRWRRNPLPQGLVQ
jgi:hypothetical protein